MIGGDHLHVAKAATSALVTSSVGDFVQLRDSGEVAEVLLHMQRIPPLPGTSGCLSLLCPCVVVAGNVYQRLGGQKLVQVEQIRAALTYSHCRDGVRVLVA